jgi:hypothetical protein
MTFTGTIAPAPLRDVHQRFGWHLHPIVSRNATVAPTRGLDSASAALPRTLTSVRSLRARITSWWYSLRPQIKWYSVAAFYDRRFYPPRDEILSNRQPSAV